MGSGGRGAVIRIFFALAIAVGWFIARGTIWNADSHLFLTYALVDDRTLAIDRFAAATGDRAFAGGHYYTDKAPGLSFLAAVPYAALRALGAAPAGPDDFLMRQLLSWVVVGLPTALTGALLYADLRCRHPGAAAWGTLAFSLGSLAWPYTTLLFSHQLVADLVLGSFLLARRGRLVPVGLLGALAFTIEPPATLLWLFLGAFALRQARPWSSRLGWQLGVVLLAGLVALGAIGLYNAAAFGSPLATGYAHLAGPAELQAGQARGFFGFQLPSPAALWGMTLSPYRGLLLLMPSLWLLPWALHRQSSAPRVAVGVGVFYLILCSAYYMWWGGAAVGPRHVVPALPLLLWPIIVKADRPVVRLFIGLSVLTMGFVTAPFPFTAPEVANPWLERWLPAWRDDRLNNNLGMLFGLRGAASLLPLVLVIGLLWPWRDAAARPDAVGRVGAGGRLACPAPGEGAGRA